MEEMYIDDLDALAADLQQRLEASGAKGDAVIVKMLRVELRPKRNGHIPRVPTLRLRPKDLKDELGVTSQSIRQKARNLGFVQNPYERHEYTPTQVRKLRKAFGVE